MAKKRSQSALPSILIAYPIPSQPIHPQIIWFLPLDSTVPSTSLSHKLSPLFFYTYDLSSDPKQLILFLFYHTTFSKSLIIYFKCLSANSNLALLLWGWVIGFSFYHKPHASNCGQITYCFGREDGAGNVLKCFYGFCSVVNLFYANNVFNIINICHGKHGRIITRTLGKVRMLLRVNIADSTTTKACLVTDLRFRKIRTKQCNNIKGFGRNQLLLGGMWWFMMLYILVSIIYVVELNISHVDLLMQAWWSTKLYS